MSSQKTEQEQARAFLEAHREGETDEVYGITDLVNELGVTARAIRLYEEKGLLTPRRVGTARIFSRRDRARLLLILGAKALGTSLEDIKHYLDLYGQHGEGRKQQLEYVVKLTAEAIAELEDKRSQLHYTQAELRLIYATCEQQLAERQRNEPKPK